jgi:putative heme-binding domain-containing protein
MKARHHFFLFAAVACSVALNAENLSLHTRSRAESEKGKGDWQPREKVVEWDAKKTAIIICDMWDQHWCKGATERVAEMAPRMNEVVKAARAKGVFIIHSPSETMKFYEGTPQRKRALEAPVAVPPVPLKKWCNLDPQREAPLPIDDSDGGCDDEPQCKTVYPWKRQIATIEIGEQDAITDSDQAYNLLQQRGIENVIVMGVHANMCVLGRPFSIRQLVGEGKNVLLMRDMTDTMYNSRKRPFVNHFRGTDLIVEHIEKFWCPSITSVDFLGGQPFRFSKDPDLSKNKVSSTYVAPPENKAEQSGPLSPEESLKRFTVFPDLEIEQVLAEPEVRQPLQLSWDARGRLWVVQYIQYPAPAGLTLLSKDQFYRAVYDKVPQPPPNHFKGLDKITIHEDTDGDGKLDKHKTFLDGLSIVTSIAHGKDGIWVLNPPYLLFFPDTTHDDVVDSDPVVHLAGFGLEDTHSVANSLRWGPDGWLYGAHGSTVTANIIRPGLDKEPIARMMGQHVWRYHPQTRRFEIFAEGGGNAFGLEMDDKGRIFSGHNGGDTRGFHYVQGAYLQKGFEKHGPLANPYAFGYFKPMANNRVERFTHTFIIYGGGTLPEQYFNKLFGVEPLQGRVVMSDVITDGSTFKTLDRGHAVTTSDKYFKPVDIKIGPDGAIYIADWYDRQVTHTRNYDGNIDKSNGRVYRLKAKGVSAKAASDLGKMTGEKLVSLLENSNRWTRQTALRLIGERNDASLAPLLKKKCSERTGQVSLEDLWALNLVGGVDDTTATELLDHKDPFVRLWTVRILGDQNHVSQRISEKFNSMALAESNVEVRSQLASTAKRLPATQSLSLVKNLLTRAEDTRDNYVPLLLWWAIESKAESDREAVLALFRDPQFWTLPLVQKTITERIMKRYAVAGTQPDLRSCAHLFQMAPRPEDKKILVAAFSEASKGRSLAAIPNELRDALAFAGGNSLSLAIRRGKKEAIAKGVNRLKAGTGPEAELAEIVAVFGEIAVPESVPGLLEIAASAKNSLLRKTAIASLQIYDEPEIALELIKGIARFPPELQLSAFNLLLTRSAWTSSFVAAVDENRIDRKIVPLEIVEKLRASPSLSPKVAAIWGEKKSLSTPVINEKIRHYSAIVQSGSGDPFAGQKNFMMSCGTCHKLFGEGGQIGPDLTTFKRDDLETILMSVVNPSGEIREGYENTEVETRDGRNLSGFLAEKYVDSIVLRGLDGQNTVLAKNQISNLKVSGMSLMPEGLLEAFDDQQVRDLFAYLRSTQPLVKR